MELKNLAAFSPSELRKRINSKLGDMMRWVPPTGHICNIQEMPIESVDPHQLLAEEELHELCRSADLAWVADGELDISTTKKYPSLGSHTRMYGIMPSTYAGVSESGFFFLLEPIKEKDNPMPTTLENNMKFATDHWDRIERSIALFDRVLLCGPPGTGKSRHAMLAGDPKEVFRCYITPETPAAEVRGHFVPGEGGAFKWHHGPAVRAWQLGGRLVIDEIDSASGDTLTLLLGILDDPETARLTLPTNETVYPKAGFSVVATTNESPDVLPAPLLDRLDVIIDCPYPHPNVIQILSPPLQKAASIDLFGDLEQVPEISLRTWLTLDRAYRKTGSMETGATLLFGDKVGADFLLTLDLGAEPDVPKRKTKAKKQAETEVEVDAS